VTTGNPINGGFNGKIIELNGTILAFNDLMFDYWRIFPSTSPFLLVKFLLITINGCYTPSPNGGLFLAFSH
jgi:hypothetical protein